MVFFLLLPLATVFYRSAPRRGSPPISRRISDPEALAAIRLTLLVAAIAVPANLVFGVAASWAIAKFELSRARAS